jgi:site-specific DNA-methyltransferase (cytosine-N4-specific)
VTGEVAERLRRKWTCCEQNEEYLQGALGRFIKPITSTDIRRPEDESNYYRVPHPSILWNGNNEEALPVDGGKKRNIAKQRSTSVREEKDAQQCLEFDDNPATLRCRR